MMHHSTATVLVSALAAIPFFPGGLPSQELLWERIGAKDVENIGWSMAPIGDVDGDGYEDLAMMYVTWIGGSYQRLRLLSGKTGKTLLEFDTKVSYLAPMLATGTGDMDGDKVPDFAVWILDRSYRSLPQKVEVRSGKTGKLIWSVQESYATWFGTSILGDLDLDGDNKPDLVVASYNLLHPKNSLWTIGGVWAFNHQGKLLYKLTGFFSGNVAQVGIGYDLGKVGDVDGDGKDDFVVGTVGNVAAGYGSAMLISGATGKTIHHGTDKTAKYPSMMAQSVDGVGDVDRDGVPDFAASGGFAGQIPILRIFSGKTGKILLRVEKKGQAQEISGRGFDFDKDGIPDLVRDAPGITPRAPCGSIFILSGRDGAVLAQIDKDWRSCKSPYDDVVVLKPPPGSDVPMFALVQPLFEYNAKTNFRGRIAVYRGAPNGVRDFGTKCKSPAARTLPEIGFRHLGGTRIRVQLANAKPGSTAYLFLGYSNTSVSGVPLPLKLGAFGFKGCSLLTSSEVLLTTQTGRSGLDAGNASINFVLPFIPKGIKLYGQWAYFDATTPGVWGFTRGLWWDY